MFKLEHIKENGNEIIYDREYEKQKLIVNIKKARKKKILEANHA